jgi:hypothetical protein
MKIQIANLQTGEVIETSTWIATTDAAALKAIRGVCRSWMKEGLNINDFAVLSASSPVLSRYVREYAWSQMLSECDVCHVHKKNGKLHWVDDKEGVLMMVLCDDCHNLPHDSQDDDAEFDAILSTLENSYEIDDEDLLTDEDIAEWQGRY